jgi:hypothetical protein
MPMMRIKDGFGRIGRGTMAIRGLDSWLTIPPEEVDWVELAEKFMKREERYLDADERKSEAYYIIDGLLTIMEDEGII